MKKPTIKRLLAYFTDLLIVLIISSIFAKIDLINPYLDQYNDTYNQYMEYVKNVDNATNILNDDNVIQLNYDLSKYGIYVSIINLVVTIIYFTFFQYMNKGQTIGKKLFKIKVISNNKSKLKFYQVLIRTLLINSILTSALMITSMFAFNQTLYGKVSEIIQLVDMTILFLSFGMMLFREDGRGIHDILAKTKVIFEVDEQKTKEAKIVSKK